MALRVGALNSFVVSMSRPKTQLRLASDAFDCDAYLDKVRDECASAHRC